MQSFDNPKAVWTGRVISGVMIALFLFDAGSKLIPLQMMEEGMKQSGLAPELLRPIGLLCLIPTILYAIPRTSVLGAVLLTGFLGGAMAAHLRDPIPAQVSHGLLILLLGGLVWAGLWLRDARLRALMPVRQS